jgi:adenosylhomocysteine nucleosidase
MTVLAIVGLKREAAIVAGSQVMPVIAGNSGVLRRRIEAALDPRVRGIISIGIAGALSPELEAGDCIVASTVIAKGARYDTDNGWTARLRRALPDPRVAPVAGADKIAATIQDKAALFKGTGADAVDMESHIAAAVAKENGLPLVALRVISDRADHTLPPAALAAMNPNGGIALGRVLRSIAFRPTQIPALMRTSRESEKAFVALLRCRDVLGPGLGCPYLGLL